MRKIDKRKYKHSCDYTEKAFLKLQKYIEETPVAQITYEQLRKLWFDVFSRYTAYWGWNTNATETMFSFGEDGHNWELLWFPPKNAKEEKQSKRDSRYQVNDYLKAYTYSSSKKALDAFIGELDYCWDRMSIDRLLRTHWQFNALCKHYFDEQKNKFLYPNLYK